MSIRVVIVDDQQLMRTGFEMILATEPDITVVAVAADGAEGIEQIRRTRPDVVLMDIRMPEMDGIEATRRLSQDADIDARVLILTTFDLDEYVYDAVRAGASGFLLKDSPADELLRAVRVVAAGDSLLSPSVTRTLIEEFARHDAPPNESTRPSPPQDLTDRETEVWRLVAQGLSNQEIADELFLAETTVKTHVSRILMKLGVRDRVQAVVAAYETGLVHPRSD